MDLRCPVKVWRKVIVLALLVVSAGCSQAVLMTQETEKGGIVTYLFKEDLGGPMESRYRKDAVKRIEEKCPAGYIVLEEGEVQGYSSMSTVGGAEGEVSGQRWGIKFRCK